MLRQPGACCRQCFCHRYLSGSLSGRHHPRGCQHPAPGSQHPARELLPPSLSHLYIDPLWCLGSPVASLPPCAHGISTHCRACQDVGAVAVHEGLLICLAGARHHLPCRSQRSAPGTQYFTRPHCRDPRSRLHQPPGRQHRTRPYLCGSSPGAIDSCRNLLFSRASRLRRCPQLLRTLASACLTYNGLKTLEAYCDLAPTTPLDRHPAR